MIKKKEARTLPKQTEHEILNLCHRRLLRNDHNGSMVLISIVKQTGLNLFLFSVVCDKFMEEEKKIFYNFSLKKETDTHRDRERER
jgi:hypothetical protein